MSKFVFQKSVFSEYSRSLGLLTTAVRPKTLVISSKVAKKEKQEKRLAEGYKKSEQKELEKMGA